MLFIMWLAFTGEVILAVNGNLLMGVLGFCLLWIAYIAVAYFVATVGQYD